jgi:hypothetical protein
MPWSRDPQRCLKKPSSRVPDAVVPVEPFLDHDPVSVKPEDGGIRDATLVVSDRTPELRVMPIQVLVEHAQFRDGSTPFVRKQGKSNAVLRRKSGERLDGIVANREQRRIGSGEVR